MNAYQGFKKYKELRNVQDIFKEVIVNLAVKFIIKAVEKFINYFTKNPYLMRFNLDYTLQEVYYNRCTSEGVIPLQFKIKKPKITKFALTVNLVVFSLEVKKQTDDSVYKFKLALKLGVINCKIHFEL